MGCGTEDSDGDVVGVVMVELMSLAYFQMNRDLSNLINATQAGLTISAMRFPEITSSINSPDPMGKACTKIRLPPLVRWSSRLNLSVTSVIHFSFSEP